MALRRPTCNAWLAAMDSKAFAPAADPTLDGKRAVCRLNANGDDYEHTATIYPDMPEVGRPHGGSYPTLIRL